MDALRWYRCIAPSYDAVCAPLYAGARRTALARLAPRPGDRVLDLCCGTGLALPALAAAVGPRGRVVGVDGCPAMLARAERRTAGLAQIRLVAADLREDCAHELLAAAEGAAFDALHVGLALAVLEDWQQVFARAWQLLRPGGRCVIYDTRPLRGGWRVFNPLFVPLAGSTGRARLRRPTWRALDDRATERSLEHRLGGFVYVSAGRRAD